MSEQSFRIPVAGDHVVFTDAHSQDRNGLVTAVWGSGNGTSINITFVHTDENRTDQYGRQLDRSNTSVVHKSQQSAPGMMWRWPDEK